MKSDYELMYIFRELKYKVGNHLDSNKTFLQKYSRQSHRLSLTT